MSKPAKTSTTTKQSGWIAERRLERHDTVGGVVVVRIGCPEWPPGAEEWRCPFMIEGLGDDSIRFSYGDESMAALQNALTGIRCILEQSGTALRWEGMKEVGFTGFSLEVPTAYGLEFQKRIEKMIRAEEEALLRPIIERNERREAQRAARRKTTKNKP